MEVNLPAPHYRPARRGQARSHGGPHKLCVIHASSTWTAVQVMGPVGCCGFRSSTSGGRTSRPRRKAAKRCVAAPPHRRLSHRHDTHHTLARLPPSLHLPSLLLVSLPFPSGPLHPRAGVCSLRSNYTHRDHRAHGNSHAQVAAEAEEQLKADRSSQLLEQTETWVKVRVEGTIDLAFVLLRRKYFGPKSFRGKLVAIVQNCR